MKRKYTSKKSIQINAQAEQVWDALVMPEKAKKYFFEAEIISDWKEGSPIVFKGEFNGNVYEEKGILLNVKPNIQLKYTHWSNLEGIPDLPENYRVWTFDLIEKENHMQLFVSEDNIPTVKKKERSNEFWNEVLFSIKKMVEHSEK